MCARNKIEAGERIMMGGGGDGSEAAFNKGSGKASLRGSCLKENLFEMRKPET